MMAQTRTRRRSWTRALGEEREQPRAGSSGAEQEGGTNREDHSRSTATHQGGDRKAELAGHHGQERPGQHTADAGQGATEARLPTGCPRKKACRAGDKGGQETKGTSREGDPEGGEKMITGQRRRSETR